MVRCLARPAPTRGCARLRTVVPPPPLADVGDGSLNSQPRLSFGAAAGASAVVPAVLAAGARSPLPESSGVVGESRWLPEEAPPIPSTNGFCDSDRGMPRMPARLGVPRLPLVMLLRLPVTGVERLARRVADIRFCTAPPCMTSVGEAMGESGSLSGFTSLTGDDKDDDVS